MPITSGAQAKALPARAARRVAGFRLHPVEEATGSGRGAAAMVIACVAAMSIEVAEPVVVLRPVHEADVAECRNRR